MEALENFSTLGLELYVSLIKIASAVQQGNKQMESEDADHATVISLVRRSLLKDNDRVAAFRAKKHKEPPFYDEIRNVAQLCFFGFDEKMLVEKIAKVESLAGKVPAEFPVCDDLDKIATLIQVTERS